MSLDELDLVLHALKFEKQGDLIQKSPGTNILTLAKALKNYLIQMLKLKRLAQD